MGRLLHSVCPLQAHLLGEVPDGADDGEERGRVAAADLVPELAGDGRRGRQDVGEQRQQQQQSLLREEQEGPTPPPQKESGRLVRAQGFGMLDTQERGLYQFMQKHEIRSGRGRTKASVLLLLSGLDVSLMEIPSQPPVLVCLHQNWQSELLKAVTAGVCGVTCSFSLLECWISASGSLWEPSLLILRDLEF